MARLEEMDKGVGRVKNTLDMAGMWKVIEQLGGAFYPDPKKCSDTEDMM